MDSLISPQSVIVEPSFCLQSKTHKNTRKQLKVMIFGQMGPDDGFDGFYNISVACGQDVQCRNTRAEFKSALETMLSSALIVSVMIVRQAVNLP